MKKIKHIAHDSDFTAIDIGRLNELEEYSFPHLVSGHTVTGKVFLKEVTGATGTEISFQMLPPNTELPYFHIHRKNEETYVFLQGEGEFQVGDNNFQIREGSIVRIAPTANRGLRNTSGESMIYMVIQSKAGSLEEYSAEDGTRVETKPNWR